MGKVATLKAKNRRKNAGGVMPDPHQTAVSLAIAFKKFTKSRLLIQDSDRMLLLFLYLWLTNQLENIINFNGLPDLQRVTTGAPCEAGCLRSYKEGNISWVEYAMPYQTSKGILYLWQPIPRVLQSLFQPLLSSLSYHTPLLSKIQKRTFYALLELRWKTPLLLRHYQRNRRNIFFNYFNYCIQVDPALSSLSKMVLLGTTKLQHQNAIAYQAEQSDRLRKKIYLAQNRYWQRIIEAINELDLKAFFSCTLLGKTKNLIAPLVPEASYLNQGGSITAYHLNTQNRSQQFEAIPSVIIGSQRSISEPKVVDFFARLHEEVEAHYLGSTMTVEQHRQYYNLRTYELALQFIVLTGVRPTHAITIERHRSFAGERVCIRDKGRWREIIVCDHLQAQMSDYQILQQQLTLHFPHHQPNSAMWHLIDEQGEQLLLNARSLRLFMHKLWPGVVPYQLRHFFAQCALTSLPPHHLATHQIDRLMGHSEFGEHLGSDNQFPLSLVPLKNYLNNLASRIGLMGRTHG